MSAHFRSVALASASLLLAACLGNPAEEVIEEVIEQNADENVDVEMQDGTMEVKTDEGNMVMGEGAELPADWSSDVPTYPGASIVYAASVNPETGEPGAAALLETSDGPEKVIAYLQSELESNGWVITGSFDAGPMQSITATKDGRMYSAAVQAGVDGGAAMTIGVNQQ